MVAIAVIASSSWPSAARSSSLPIPKGNTYLLPVGEHDLRQVLLNFGRANGISVNISPEITGSVPGTGQLQASADFISAITSRGGLSWFSFRDTVYFSRSQDSIEASISVKAPQQAAIRTALTAMKLLDERFTWTELPAQNQVLVFGPRPYVQLVRQQTARLQPVAPTLPPKPVVESSEAMIFKLKYASAVDKPTTPDGMSGIRLGIASILNSLYNPSASLASYARSRQPTLNRSRLPSLLGSTSAFPTGAAPAAANAPTGSLPTVPAILALGESDGPLTSLHADALAQQRALLSAGMPAENRADLINGNEYASSAFPYGIDPRRNPRGEPAPVIEADPRTNSILIRDRSSRRSEYERVIASLDVPIQQIELETILIDMQEDDIARSLAKLPKRGTLDTANRQGPIILTRETASALLAYAKAINKRGRSDLTVLSQTVVFKQDEAFNLDFADDHVYPELSTPIWKRLAAEVVTTATQPQPSVRSTLLKITGTASFTDGKIELQAAIEESRNRPDLPSKTFDRRHTGMQMSVGLTEGDVCVLSNTSYFTGSDMSDSRGRLVLLSARRHGSFVN